MRMKGPSDLNVAKHLVVDVAVAIVKTWDDLLQTLAELISAPWLELLLLRKCNVTKRRDSASNTTRRVIVSSNARS
jgi:hypothetical protein